MKIMIFGLGSIGQRHARLLLDTVGHEVYAFRSGKDSQPNTLGITEIYSWDEVKEIKPDAAFITNPTDLHIKTALQCACLGMHLFIEKPLSNELKDIDKLVEICNKNKLTCYTAYCLRFHPVIKKLREILFGKIIYHVRIVCSSYLPDWRQGRVVDGEGILLDLSHEFDYIKYLFGEIQSMKGKFANLSRLTKESEDYADVLIETENSIHVNLHLDCFSRLAERTIKIDLEDGYVFADLIEGSVEVLFRGGKEIFRFDPNRDIYLLEQSRYFFNNLGNLSIMNNIRESKSLLGKILELKNGK